MDISIKDLVFAYKSAPEKTILKDITLDIAEGQFVCLLGQSGCGKSTLLRLVAGLEKPVEGSISVDGKPVEGAGFDRAVVFQDYGLFPWMTAGDNLVLALRQRFPEMTKKQAKDRSLELLEMVGLDKSVAKKLPKELSGGMKQRCAIAQAFSLNSPILLMDEPFGALDAVTRARLQDLVLELWAENEPRKTVLFVTHDVDEAMLLATRVVVLGQSPSHIIFDRVIPDEDHPTRETQFDNLASLKLRNELIRCINSDIATRMS